MCVCVYSYIRERRKSEVERRVRGKREICRGL